MGKKGPKIYCRFCTEYHSQFEGFKLPVGAIYGRIDTTFFVSLYRVNKHGCIRVFLKTPDTEWELKPVPVDGEICKMIANCIEENSDKRIVVGRYNPPNCKHKRKKQGSDLNPNLEIIEIDGKKYQCIPSELPLPDIKTSKEFKGITPNLRNVNSDFNARMRPNNERYGVKYNGKQYVFFEYAQAEKFCKELDISEDNIYQEFFSAESASEVNNECSWWAIYKDVNRKLAWNPKTGNYC